MDEACANKRVQLESVPEEIDNMLRQKYRLQARFLSRLMQFLIVAYIIVAIELHVVVGPVEMCKPADMPYHMSVWSS